MQMKRTPQEMAAACLALARECECDRSNAFNFFELFSDGPARVFVNWCRTNIGDQETYDVGGHHVRVDGWQWGGDQSTEAVLRRRWETRAGIYFALHRDELRHVIDWLLVSAAEVEPWTHRRDINGRVPKMVKASTIADLAAEADRWMQRAPSPVFDLEPYNAEEHELAISDLGAGYTLVRLLTPRALDRETAALRHCVGRGSYDQLVESGRSEIYSIRDPAGAPQATVEIRIDGDHKYVVQVKGYLNEKPERHIRDLVLGSMAELGWSERMTHTLWDQPAAIRYW
ncbi:hypothetical protein ELI48_02285 [Rhizobium ruizarguesonis]|nr:hypothetical protein ELI48_02285 [Rhizobium ruizarguesonis]TAW08505.1 hypothetical protein ELI26_02275 [Rhizobium ruizarguesonis]